MPALLPFDRVLDQHATIVFAVCRAHAGVQLADEVFQETMLAALRAYPELRDPDAVRGWLCAIAVRKAIDAHRAAGRRPTPVDEHELAALAGKADSAVADPVGDAQLWTHVRSLPSKQRSAVTLRYLGDLTNTEIGEVLGISTDAARRNVFEGLQRLRSHTEDDRDVLSL